MAKISVTCPRCNHVPRCNQEIQEEIPHDAVQSVLADLADDEALDLLVSSPKKTWLVVGRCIIDDIPICMYGDEEVARKVAMELSTDHIVNVAGRVFGLDVSVFCNVSIVPFIDGVPQPFILVKEFQEEEP